VVRSTIIFTHAESLPSAQSAPPLARINEAALAIITATTATTEFSETPTAPRFERDLQYSQLLIVPGSFEYPEVGPNSQKRADASAQEMENFMDIVHLEKFMERVVDHFDLLYAP
jgi:hypothetical protein